MKELDALIQQNNFDLLKNSLAALAKLFNTHYVDEKRRAAVVG